MIRAVCILFLLCSLSLSAQTHRPPHYQHLEYDAVLSNINNAWTYSSGDNVFWSEDNTDPTDSLSISLSDNTDISFWTTQETRKFMILGRFAASDGGVYPTNDGGINAPSLIVELWNGATLVEQLYSSTLPIVNSVWSAYVAEISSTAWTAFNGDYTNARLKFSCDGGGGGPSSRTGCAIDLDQTFILLAPTVGWYGGASSSFVYRKRLDINSQNFGDTLSGCVNHLALSRITDTDFWNNVQDDGDDIRICAIDGTTELPIDVVEINTTDETGAIFFRDFYDDYRETVYFLYWGDPTASGYSTTATYGRHNVWQDWEYAWILNTKPDATITGQYPNRTTDTHAATFVGDTTGRWAPTGSSFLDLRSIDFGSLFDEFYLDVDGDIDFPNTFTAFMMLDCDSWSYSLDGQVILGQWDEATGVQAGDEWAIMQFGGYTTTYNIGVRTVNTSNAFMDLPFNSSIIAPIDSPHFLGFSTVGTYGRYGNWSTAGTSSGSDLSDGSWSDTGMRAGSSGQVTIGGNDEGVNTSFNGNIGFVGYMTRELDNQPIWSIGRTWYNNNIDVSYSVQSQTAAGWKPRIIIND